MRIRIRHFSNLAPPSAISASSTEMITLVVATNRPGSRARAVSKHVEEIYRELGVQLTTLDLANLPPEIFNPNSYEETPASFAPFQQAVTDSHGLVVVTPEYNGSIPGIFKYFIDMLEFPVSFERRPVCFGRRERDVGRAAAHRAASADFWISEWIYLSRTRLHAGN